jgi:hypothetical protein
MICMPVASGYELRTVELQTSWKLVPAHGPLHFRCADGADIDVTYFETQPSSLIATRKGEQSLMRSAPAASGALPRPQRELLGTSGRGAPRLGLSGAGDDVRKTVTAAPGLRR